MRIGLDIGSTTIKCVVLDEENRILYSAYERHYSHILEKCDEMLAYVDEKYLRNHEAKLAISGSAGMGLAETAGIPFVQEVYATRVAAARLSPDTDCIIELGGEDAKILFLSGGMEVRMNGSCAGGTGAFIDQMASLLKLTPAQMDAKAQKAERSYTIASRCGVFAKSDIQPLINQGAKSGDIALSIYQAVVNQTIAGLAQGRMIKGNVLYLGGPLTFSKCLRACFDRTLSTNGVLPENSLLYVALGAAYYADQTLNVKAASDRLRDYSRTATYIGLEPLFESREAYWKFHNRHMSASVPRAKFDETCGRVHIGIDSGSTTIKLVVINEKNEILHAWYENNEGNPVPLIRNQLMDLYRNHPGLEIGSVTATGYGEELMKHAFRLDFGLVETVAHFTAARHFMPDVDFIIDIGGQDMKCFRIENNAISDVFLNEACSSGCGSFLQTFARAMNYDVQEFSRMGLFAKRPVDLGSRCTVFMNSSVKQAQKDGAGMEDISAGLSISVVKNALYKVIRCASVEELGKRIVVQGGTFYNEAVLRAFEKEMKVDVVRPDIAGLMGAFGAALYGKDRAEKTHKSTLLSLEELEKFEQKTESVTCNGCGNHCLLTISRFSGAKPYISGNRCDKPVTGVTRDDHLNLYAWKRDQLQKLSSDSGEALNGTIGIPLVLNMYELLPFWHAFWKSLGYKVIVSPFSDRDLYQKGQASIPSDTACYPAKLSHGHISWLCEHGADAVFYPCMSYNFDEKKGDNHYNCPVVAYYPEVLEDNCSELRTVPLIRDFIDLSNREVFAKKYPKILKKHFPGLKTGEIRRAMDAAYLAYESSRRALRNKGAEIVAEARKEGRHIIVLAGRPYHTDPEVSHGIDRLITKLGCAVITEDAVSDYVRPFPTSVLNQWTFHSRLYAAAKYCTETEDMDLVQLVSFGCGLDAITSDETREILHEGGSLYTQLKIDEIVNLGTVNIRLRSLLAALEEKKIQKQRNQE